MKAYFTGYTRRRLEKGRLDSRRGRESLGGHPGNSYYKIISTAGSTHLLTEEAAIWLSNKGSQGTAQTEVKSP